jgi:hypothetical protein
MSRIVTDVLRRERTPKPRQPVELRVRDREVAEDVAHRHEVALARAGRDARSAPPVLERPAVLAGERAADGQLDHEVPGVGEVPAREQERADRVVERRREGAVAERALAEHVDDDRLRVQRLGAALLRGRQSEVEPR